LLLWRAGTAGDAHAYPFVRSRFLRAATGRVMVQSCLLPRSLGSAEDAADRVELLLGEAAPQLLIEGSDNVRRACSAVTS
jgi:hypothetical protein